MRKPNYMNKLKKHILTLFCIVPLSISNLLVSEIPSTFAQTVIVVTVNGKPITNYDIQRRAAFLRLQQKQGNLSEQAKNELINEVLKNIEIKRRNIEVSNNEVESAFKTLQHKII